MPAAQLAAGIALATALAGGGAAVVTHVTAPPPPTAQTAAHRCVAAPARASLDDPTLKNVARMIVSSAENSSLHWESQYGYIEYDVEGNAKENRGYTAGLVGFTSKTHDMLVLVRDYTKSSPANPLARYLPALQAADGTSSKKGLGPGFVDAWKQAAKDPAFKKAQRTAADAMYYKPAIARAKADGLRALGQFAYVDAMIMHGPGDRPTDFGGIRAAALRKATPPSRGGDEKRYLTAFLDARVAAMRAEEAHSDTSRVDGAQRRWLAAGNLDLATPLTWTVYGDDYRIDGPSGCR